MRKPAGLKAPGAKLWESTLEQYELSDAELAILEEACRCRDRIKQLDRVLDEQGVMAESSQGIRVHPALTEVRQQRLLLARLMATLSIPPLDDDALPAARKSRGVYRRGA